jgi:O-antigen ligase
MFKSRPVVGIGWSRFTDSHNIVAHNSFVHVLTELGLVGAFFFVGFVYWFFRSLRVVRAQPSDPSPTIDWATALAGSGIGLFTSASFLSRQYSPAFYTVCALGAAYAGLRGAGTALAARPPGAFLLDMVIIAGIELIAIVLVYVTVLTFAVWGS